MTLYRQLMTLVENNEAFYYKDFTLNDRVYRIFNYRLASYSDFCKPGALECRGIMFDVTPGHDGEPIIVTRPMEKFFNLNENPMTQNLDLTKIVAIEEKADGSLISTYMHNGHLRLKTKGSLESQQCIDAMQWLQREDNTDLRIALRDIAMMGYTVNMEWCAPDNRVVVGYRRPHLTILNIRKNDNGVYYDLEFFSTLYSAIRNYGISRVCATNYEEFVQSVSDQTGIEGYVLHFEDGLKVKIKTEWYVVQHRAKDSINSPRRLFEAVLEETVDDLRSLFHDDELVLSRIDYMEAKVAGIYNHIVDQVERFYERNKHMERKEYAILGQKELDRKIFGLAMSKYTGKPVDYVSHMKKHYKDYGIGDENYQEID